MIATTEKAIIQLDQQYRVDRAAMEAKQAAARKLVNAAESGESAEAFAAGALYLDIRWGDPRFKGPGHYDTPEVRSAFESVIEALRISNDILLTHDAAVKHYDSWLSQNETWTQHGYGPRHGSLWFHAGLKRGWAVDKPQGYAMPPTEDDRLLCIQYIKAIMRRPELL